MQSVLSAISPSSILGSVKKLANGGVVETGSAPTNAAAVGPDVRSQVSPISAMNMESGTVRVQSSPLAPIPKTLETAKDRIRQILADSDDEDLAISAALSKATNLVEEVRGGSGMSK